MYDATYDALIIPTVEYFSDLLPRIEEIAEYNPLPWYIEIREFFPGPRGQWHAGTATPVFQCTTVEYFLFYSRTLLEVKSASISVSNAKDLLFDLSNRHMQNDRQWATTIQLWTWWAKTKFWNKIEGLVNE